MSSARCASTHDLFRNRQVDADDAILEKANLAVCEQLGDCTSKRRVEKGSLSLGIFVNLKRFPSGDKHRNVHKTLREPPLKLLDELLLIFEYLGRRPVANQSDVVFLG